MDRGVRVPIGPAPRPVAEGNCVTVRWGGEQPEAKRRSAEPVPGLTREDEPDSARRRGEPAGERRSRGEETASGGWGQNVAKSVQGNPGDLPVGVRLAGVRVCVVARKRRNGRGAKAGREVDA